MFSLTYDIKQDDNRLLVQKNHSFTNVDDLNRFIRTLNKAKLATKPVVTITSENNLHYHDKYNKI